MQGGAVDLRTQPEGGGKALAPNRVHHTAHNGLTPLEQGNGDRVLRITAQEIHAAIDRVDEPGIAVRVEAGGFPRVAFLAPKLMRGKGVGDARAQLLLDGGIKRAAPVARRFLGHAVGLGQALGNRGGGFACQALGKVAQAE